jgi:two-component system cell cycle response regulator
MSPAPRDLIVMVVDDDPAIRRLTRKLLEDDAFVVVESASGAEAMQKIVEERWHILLLDLNLGDLDGATLLKKVKSDEQFVGRHVIILSADADPLKKVALLDLGADDYVSKPFHPAELVARVRAGGRFVDLQRKLIALNSEDGLTHLFNHKYFQEKLALEFDSSLRYTRPLSIAMIDVDDFKHVNDTQGHAGGDRLLETIAKALLEHTRSSDVAARYGGDEFALILRETSIEDAIRCANRISDAVRDLGVTLSIGLAALPHRRITKARQLLEYADRALYRAKRSGKDQVQAWGRSPSARPIEAASAATLIV